MFQEGIILLRKKYKWSVISVSTQTSFFQNKVSVNSSMSIDPYQIILRQEKLQEPEQKISGILVFRVLR